MAEQTEISWAHSTFNPWIGCTKVSPGCDHCYAETLDRNRFSYTMARMDGPIGEHPERQRIIHWGAGAPRHRTSTANWRLPLKWNAKARESGQPWRVFCASLADVFDNEIDPTWRVDLFRLIEETPHLTWLLLTKRIGNVERMVEIAAPYHRLAPNVWLGITVVNQEEADRDIPKLLEVQAAKHWLSCEPLLGPINFKWEAAALDWVIVGGESGHGARTMDPAWATSIRDQCERNGVAFHFKQWGPRGIAPLLDGREHRAFPTFS